MPARACSVARTLEVIGDRWTLLVLREVMLGNRRFADIVTATGAPRAVLSQRLAGLVEHGLLSRRRYTEPRQRGREEYCPTTAARDLQPVLTALMDWGDRHLAGPDGPPAIAHHEGCGAAVHAELRCTQGHPVAAREVRVVARTP
jgi:DNA-binding HxlR family transcriptional regulator